MKVKILQSINGLINGEEWPAVGQTIDLPTHVAEGMVASGAVEAVKQKAPSKPDESEKRPAVNKGTETRKK